MAEILPVNPRNLNFLEIAFIVAQVVKLSSRIRIWLIEERFFIFSILSKLNASIYKS